MKRRFEMMPSRPMFECSPHLRAIALDALRELNPRHSPSHHISEDGAAVLKLASGACPRHRGVGDRRRQSTARGAFFRASAACEGKKSERPSSPTTMASPSITALRTFKA